MHAAHNALIAVSAMDTHTGSTIDMVSRVATLSNTCMFNVKDTKLLPKMHKTGRPKDAEKNSYWPL